MAIHNFQITSYTMKLAGTMGANFEGKDIKIRGIIQCKGTNNQSVVVYFLADDSHVPAATTNFGGKWGMIFLPKELLAPWTDMLRNEKPLYGYVNTDYPERTSVATTNEPVGEEET